MASRNQLIPDSRATQTDQKNYVIEAVAAGLERCQLKGIGNLNADIPGLESIAAKDLRVRVDLIKKYLQTGLWPKSIEMAPLDPTTELVAATALDDWLTAALAVVGTFYTCTQAIVAPQMLAGKLMVCWGVSLANAPQNVSKLRFRKGGAAANIVAEFDLQELETKQEACGFFAEPVIYDPQDIFAIQARCQNVTGVAERVYIRNFVFGTPTRTV